MLPNLLIALPYMDYEIITKVPDIALGQSGIDYTTGEALDVPDMFEGCGPVRIFPPMV